MKGQDRVVVWFMKGRSMAWVILKIIILSNISGAITPVYVALCNILN